MGVFFDHLYMDVLAVLATIFIGIYTYFKWSFKYWERRGLPYIEPSIPFGTLSNGFVKRVAFGEQIEKLYQHAKARKHKHIGMYIFAAPMYLVIDPEYIKHILTRDFDYFMNHGAYSNEKGDPLSAHLFAIEGAKWRNLRMKLTPTFTSGKMKMMFPTLVQCGDQLKDYIRKAGNEPIDTKDVLSRYTTDVIGSCAFGLECNSFKNPHSEFGKYLIRIFKQTPLESLKALLSFIAPDVCRFFGVVLTPKEVTEFIMGVVKETVDFREKNNFVRKDFMQLLLALKNNVNDGGEEYQHDGKSLTMNELAAQAFLFLLAGYETSATTMTFCLFELAVNPEIQHRAREEINHILKKHDGNITYEAIWEMKYLGQVVEETLRKYPALPVLSRKCTVDYQIPDTNITIERGTLVNIPIIGLHHDEDYYPDSQKFDPERFNEENKSKINHFTYLPFGEGPRACIGLRFGLMQTKVGLTILLHNFAFSLNKKTKTPLRMDPSSFILSALGDIWLDVRQVDN